MKNRTQALLARVKLLLEVGTNGNFAKEFAEIEIKLNKIQTILDNQKLTEVAIRNLEKLIEEATRLLNQMQKTYNEYDEEATLTTNRTIEVLMGLHNIDAEIHNLTLMLNQLDDNANQAQGGDVDGAYKIILNSQKRSREAEQMVNNLTGLISEEQQKRRKTEFMNTTLHIKFNSTILQNEANLYTFSMQINDLENKVPGINRVVCASSSTVNNCDQLCGGALCDKCGGLSCSEGATTKASNALDLANQAWDLLNQKLNQSKLDLEGVNEAKNQSLKAFDAIKLVMTDCDIQKQKFVKIANEIDEILNGIDQFSLLDGARPAEVRTLGTECLQLTISLTPEQILQLVDKIKHTISYLTNIDQILRDTARDLEIAIQLRKRADEAKAAAENILEIVEQILAILRAAAIEQARARAAIEVAKADIEGAQADLSEIITETELIVGIIDQLGDDLKKLRIRLKALEEKFAQNQLYLNQANTAAGEANRQAGEAEKLADELAAKIRLAEEKLFEKARRNGELEDRAGRLKNDAVNLAAEIKLRMELLRELDDLFDENVKRLKDYQNTIDDLHKQMNQYIKDIDLRAQYYRECQT